MIILHSYAYEKDADEAYRRFIRDNGDCVECGNNAKKFVKLNDGVEHIFMGENRYCSWCKGRTYMDTDGIVWHSGCPIKQC